MGVKLFKRKKYNRSLGTPSKVGTNNEANTPDTAPGSPIPQEETELPISTPKNAMVEPPIPTSYNKRMMESETPLVSNVASNSQQMVMPPIPSSYNNMHSETAPVSNIPQQVKSNQIRNEIGQYYDKRDGGTAREMTAQPTQKASVTRTFSHPAVGVRAFSMDESEDVELQLTSDSPFQMRSPVDVRNNVTTTQRRFFSKNRSHVPKFVSKLNQDEVSIPSVITDPEGTSVQSLPVVEENLNAAQQEPESTWSKVSLKNKVIDGGQSIDDAIKSLFTSDKTSAATQAGGIEQLLGFLKCNEDTTCAPIQQCDALCGQEITVEKDVVDLENEQEQEFALKFNNVRGLLQRVCLLCRFCHLFYSCQLCRVFVT